MTTQPSRSYTGLAIAVLVTALVTGSLAYLSVSPADKTTTRVVTVSGTTSFNTSANAIVSTTAGNTGSRVYEVAFQQISYCGRFNIIPWAVTLNGLTEVEPSNQSLPLPTNTFSTIVPDQNLTRITFSVPAGTYSYAVSGGTPNGPGGELYPGSGTVEVSGTDTIVNVQVSLGFTCTSSTAA